MWPSPADPGPLPAPALPIGCCFQAEATLHQRLREVEAALADASDAERAAMAKLAAAGEVRVWIGERTLQPVGRFLRALLGQPFSVDSTSFVHPSPHHQPPHILSAPAEASASAAKEAASAAVETGAESRGRLEAERRRAATLEAERAAAEERLAAAQAREQVRPLAQGRIY